MEYKEDVVEAKERMNAWWDHEIIDRPVLSYYYPKKRGKLGTYLDTVGENWTLAENHDNIESAMDGYEKRAKDTYFGGESIPFYFPNYGPGIMAAVFGVSPLFKSNTVWFSQPIKPENIVEHLESIKLNQNNVWYSRLLRITEVAAKRAKKDYLVSVTDIGGVLDILSSFLGPTNIILTMKRNPNIIDTCRTIILEKLLKVYDDLQKKISQFCDGCNCWLGVWSKKRWYALQSDFSAMLNPAWFKKFVLPDLVKQAEHMDYAIYHLDGPNALPHLDSLLNEPSITGIQWVPGAGNAEMGSKDWIPLYKKIQKAGKNLVIDSAPENVSHLYKSLDTKGLFVRTFYRSEYITNQYLPKFIGGREGKIVVDVINWLKERGENSITNELLNDFLLVNNLEIENRYRKDLLKEIFSFFTRKWHY
jgi:5-methyltetrahydrofolate--homocysteine methyltransferase